MKTSKSLTSAIAAAALVGAIGVAYAQSAPVGAANSNLDTTTQNSGSRLSTSNTYGSNMGSSNLAAPETAQMAPAAPATTMGAATPAPAPMMSNDTTAFQTERPAQADRN
ncbi:MAG: hypothetical protein EOO28_04165 [Comamonadaceae bacterium]|nr:MAG: hypothetical protein EOO28_04165 [Comamonadaceae bacterium]